MFFLLNLIFSFTIQSPIVFAAPTKRLSTTAVITADFPDPSLIRVRNGWYSFATTNGKNNVQIARSQDFAKWTVLGQDALPRLPAWASGPVWAPDVIQRDDGSFVMYYSAALTQFSAHHCVGAAFSANIEGPYIAQDHPLVCPDPTGNGANLNPSITSPGAGGAIDAAGFRDTDGQLYLLWKVDGNSVGSGGVCGNTIAPQRSTPIMIVAVQADGVTPKGNPIQLLDRDDSDGPLVEAPNLVRTTDGGYVLFYSSNCYTTPGYDVAYATSKTLLGPYVKAPNPLIMTGTQGLSAPGGASIAADGQHMVFHANVGTGRGMFATTISGDANSNSIRFS
ncbi:hypothetical protein FKW77_004311 [Venturia effusa]|uniref:Glycoside hydrolase family 43 protein n=1 Tax=Venturia effusa TaxID=50376 RepID=A0A517LAV0_9PEZI|nr:hypothetical protein FKW77_004311 [Venturia effusa]